MKKTLYALALLFLNQTHAQTPDLNYGTKDKVASHVCSTPVYYSKSSGVLTELSTWGNKPDGSGSAPGSFTGDQIFKVRNREGKVQLQSNWEVSNVDIGDNITLCLEANTLTIKEGSIFYNTSGKLQGSPLASIVTNNKEKSVVISLDASEPGKTNALKDLKIRNVASVDARSISFGSDIHIVRNLELSGGDLILSTYNIYLKSANSLLAPGLEKNAANIFYNGNGRFVIEQLNADGKRVYGLIAQPYTESSPANEEMSDSREDQLPAIGFLRSKSNVFNEPAFKLDSQLLLTGKCMIADDIRLFLNRKFLDLYTKTNGEKLYC
ncbi:hypothetical protein [Pedobacter sp. SYSU D00535]|uniref:hypothetical protein n=1 Tax=Pedobacter sp. SYSU D00535 TaxID=2810308 RepID=UPI001A9701DC|nr:hypothetical protein [Pedobacter sp. SYSU D00535]